MSEHGFKGVTPLPEGRERLRSVCEPTGRVERCRVADADGRVLADPVTAGRAVPHYDRAAMDGYAVQARATFDASERSPISLSPSTDKVGRKEAVRVHTGSALPDGADAVVMVEHTERRDGDLFVYDAVAAGENVGKAGEDVETGQTLFEGGRRLSPSDLALLRATDCEEVSVVNPPRVSVVPTGEELVPAGVEPDPGEIVETNGLLVSKLVERWGGEPTYRDIVTDDRNALRNAIDRDIDHDVVVTTGGSSVGERDLVADVVEAAGTQLFHGVAIKPGHPMGCGVVDDTVVLMLPGYPVSCLVTAVQFLRPTIAWLSDTKPHPHPRVRGRLTKKLRSEPGTRTFARVRIASEADGDDHCDPGDSTAVTPVRTGGASVLSSVTTADGWVVVPESREGIAAGETVAVQEWECATPRPQLSG